VVPKSFAFLSIAEDALNIWFVFITIPFDRIGR